MAGTQDVDKCLQMCQQTAKQLQGLSNQAKEPMIKNMLFEASHHLDLCVGECKFVTQKAQQPAGTMA